ncbi:Carbonyl reductase [NADPH] 1 [Smittium culicis]|uniref:Carbonyl reductase [NADPH] 1 n=1 Tax=Smittium culicis TaxID=133412 RepID=A0A1R1Y3B8_9FUNG|nr:Carbonyl reductase [NADPH] 1 [Smittium culicis]
MRITEPTLVYLTSRSESAGESAVANVMKVSEAKRAAGVTAKYHQLDINDEVSIRKFREDLLKEHGERCIDVLVNNAGVMDNTVEENKGLKETIETNYYGTKRVTEILLDLMNEKGRIVFISSMMGELSNHSSEVQEKFSAADLQVQELDNLMEDFVKSKCSGVDNSGYCANPYSTSKTGVTMYARILARDYANDPRGLLFTSCHPGWVKTDMGGPDAPLSVEMGVQTPIHLVTEDYSRLLAYNGMYFTRKTVDKF